MVANILRNVHNVMKRWPISNCVSNLCSPALLFQFSICSSVTLETKPRDTISDVMQLRRESKKISSKVRGGIRFPSFCLG